MAACQLEYFLTADRISFPVNVLYQAYFFQENKVMHIKNAYYISYWFMYNVHTMYRVSQKTREFSDELDIVFVMN